MRTLNINMNCPENSIFTLIGSIGPNPMHNRGLYDVKDSDGDLLKNLIYLGVYRNTHGSKYQFLDMTTFSVHIAHATCSVKYLGKYVGTIEFFND